MYIKRRTFTLVYRGLIGALSLVVTWSLFAMFGEAAWRLFLTWTVVVASIYYIGTTIFAVLFGKRKGNGWTPAATWQLALLITFGLVVAEWLMGEGVAEVRGQIGLLVRLVLPILVLIDWLVFSKKGQFRLVDPWYALALPACYAAWILISADTITSQAWKYPYQNFEIAAVGVPTMLWWLVLMMVIILLAGYIIYLLDFAMSGKLSKYIVMPKIKLVEVVDDEPTERKPAVKNSATVEATSVKHTAPTKPKTTQKTMDVAQPKNNAHIDLTHHDDNRADSVEAIPVAKKSRPLTPEKQEKLERQTTTPVEAKPPMPDKPEEPKAPQVPQIENHKKDKKSAQNLHGKK